MLVSDFGYHEALNRPLAFPKLWYQAGQPSAHGFAGLRYLYSCALGSKWPSLVLVDRVLCCMLGFAMLFADNIDIWMVA